MTKLCKVYILSLSFHYLITAEICSNLTEPGNKDIRNQVQMEVNNYKLYQQYMDIPQSFISLYLGPISGQSGPVLVRAVTGSLLFSRPRQEASDGVAVPGPHRVRRPHDPQHPVHPVGRKAGLQLSSNDLKVFPSGIFKMSTFSPNKNAMKGVMTNFFNF